MLFTVSAVPRTQKTLVLIVIHRHDKKKVDNFSVTTNISIVSRVVYKGQN